MVWLLDSGVEEDFLMAHKKGTTVVDGAHVKGVDISGSGEIKTFFFCWFNSAIFMNGKCTNTTSGVANQPTNIGVPFRIAQTQKYINANAHEMLLIYNHPDLKNYRNLK